MYKNDKIKLKKEENLNLRKISGKNSGKKHNWQNFIHRYRL
jgi:hypothetical protein